MQQFLMGSEKPYFGSISGPFWPKNFVKNFPPQKNFTLILSLKDTHKEKAP